MKHGVTWIVAITTLFVAQFIASGDNNRPSVHQQPSDLEVVILHPHIVIHPSFPTPLNNQHVQNIALAKPVLLQESHAITFEPAAVALTIIGLVCIAARSRPSKLS